MKNTFAKVIHFFVTKKRECKKNELSLKFLTLRGVISGNFTKVTRKKAKSEEYASAYGRMR